MIVSYPFLSDEFDHGQKQDWLMGSKPFRAVYSQPRERFGIEMEILFHVECKLNGSVPARVREYLRDPFLGSR